MCKLLIGIKVNDSANKKFARIIKAQEHSLSNQPHGISALIVDKDNNISVKKELNEYGKVFVWVQNRIKNAKIVAIHSRQATDGEIDEANLHFFEIDDYFFAHNGIVGEYSDYQIVGRQIGFPVGQTFHIVENNEEKEIKENEMSDSYNFLLNIPKPITKLSLVKEIENTRFTGVGVLVDKQKKRMIVFSTREMKAHTDFKNYFLIYSYDPTNTLVDFKSILGFQVIVKDNGEKLKAYSVPAGIYEVNYLKVGKN